MAINIKRLLANALISLSEEKPLQKITITDIITKAGTGRQTFYNHFQDKSDLIYWIFLHTLSGERKIVETQGYYPYLIKLHQEAQKISHFLAQACKLTGQNSLREALYEQNYRYYKNYIINHYGPEIISTEMEFALQFNAYGGSNVYIRWALAGMPGSAESQALLVLECMPQRIRNLLPLYINPFEDEKNSSSNVAFIKILPNP